MIYRRFPVDRFHRRGPEEVAHFVDGLLATPKLKRLVAGYFAPANGFAGATFDALGEPNPAAWDRETAGPGLGAGPVAVPRAVTPRAD